MTDVQLDLGLILDHYGIDYRADRGGEQGIRCPVHEDRVASASLNLDKQLFNCHACGKRGDALTVIMEREGVEYATALEKYETITGTSVTKVRGAVNSSAAGRLSGPKLPAGQGYKPRVNRKLPPGVRKRTDFGA